MATRFHTPTPHWTHTLWFLDRTRVWWFVGLALLYAAGFNGQWRTTPDSAVHVDAARVMIDGRAPRVDPLWIEKIQPGLSTVLAGVGGLTGSPASDGFGGLASLAMLGFAAITLALTYRLMILHADRPTAVLMVILLGTNHLFYELSFNLLTEMPFAVGFVLLLWGHERRLKLKKGLALSLLMMAAGVAWMATFRSVAAVVVGAYLLAETVRVIGRRDQRRLGLILLGVGAATAAGLWLSSSAVRDDSLLLGRNLGRFDPERLLHNARELYDAVLPEAVMGVAIPPPVSWGVSALVAAVGVYLLRVRLLWATLVAVFAAQWLIFVADIRYVLPLLPVLIYGGWTLLIAAASRLPRRAGNFLFGFVGFCVVGGNLVGIGFTIAEQRSAAFYESYRNGHYVAVRELAETIRQETADHESVLILASSRSWAELAVWSDRPVRKRILEPPPPETATYVLLPLDDRLRFQLGRAKLTWGPPVAEVVASDGDESWTLHEVDISPPEPANRTP